MPVLLAASISITSRALPSVMAWHMSARVARFALAVGSAVDGLGQNAPGAGLAGAPGAAEEIGMGHAAAREGIEQGLGDVLLSDDFSQGLGAPFAIENLRSHRQPYPARPWTADSTLCSSDLISR